MGLFRLDEVFQIAMQAEETGRLLYESTAAQAKDAKVAELCRQLAAQEKGHYEKFAAMAKALPENISARRLSLEEMDFVDALVRGRVVPAEEEAKRTARENSLPALLDLAIRAERDSQAFYGQILPWVDAKEAGLIRDIIAEESRHERLLTDVRAKMPS